MKCVQEFGKKIERTLAGNWWVGEESCRGCSKRGPALEEAGGEKGRKEIVIWMEVADRWYPPPLSPPNPLVPLLVQMTYNNLSFIYLNLIFTNEKLIKFIIVTYLLIAMHLLSDVLSQGTTEIKLLQW